MRTRLGLGPYVRTALRMCPDLTSPTLPSFRSGRGQDAPLVSWRRTRTHGDRSARPIVRINSSYETRRLAMSPGFYARRNNVGNLRGRHSRKVPAPQPRKGRQIIAQRTTLGSKFSPDSSKPQRGDTPLATGASPWIRSPSRIQKPPKVATLFAGTCRPRRGLRCRANPQPTGSRRWQEECHPRWGLKRVRTNRPNARDPPARHSSGARAAATVDTFWSLL
jgi:hypothetical protein